MYIKIGVVYYALVDLRVMYIENRVIFPLGCHIIALSGWKSEFTDKTVSNYRSHIQSNVT